MENKKLFDVVMNKGREDERVRMISLNGSRVNKNVLKDKYQDYDIVYLVDNVREIIEDDKFLKTFNNIAIMQEPDKRIVEVGKHISRYAYLIQFKDGSRLDLQIIDKNCLNEYLNKDSLVQILLDKDGLLDRSIVPNESSHYIAKPDKIEYLECSNEFQWISLYIAKALIRHQYIYARSILDGIFRPMYIKMLSWKIGVESGFDINLGKNNKYILDYLSDEDIKLLLSSYKDSSIDEIWDVVFNIYEPFRKNAFIVGDYFDYWYPCPVHENVWDLILQFKNEYDKNLLN